MKIIQFTAVVLAMRWAARSFGWGRWPLVAVAVAIAWMATPMLIHEGLAAIGAADVSFGLISLLAVLVLLTVAFAKFLAWRSAFHKFRATHGTPTSRKSRLEPR